MASVSFCNVIKRYGIGPKANQVIHGVSAEIADHEFIVIVGPSGCGKSTLLRMVAGLEEISAGEIRIGERVVNNLEPAERDIAMVFQNYALYPHMSVFDNMAYGLKIAKTPRAEIKTRVDKAAQILELGPLLERKPRQLSGGQRQRVAMGRAIVRQPQVFLFDEPLSNLDAKLRAQTRLEIQKLHRELGITSLFVTHDQVEAMTLAQRILVMNGGVMDQFATPEEVYSRPATTFVAGFTGSPPMNLLRQAPGVRPGMILGIRPEHLAPDPGGWAVRIEHVELLGAERLIYGRIGDEPLVIRADESQPPPAPGDTLRIGARPDRLHWFDAGSGKRTA
jgi:sn-glycerol 3-phosphate transport system ATP-binding protein